MTALIAPVVEGETEVQCVPPLLHRVWREVLAAPDRLQVVEPYNAERSQLVHPSKDFVTEVVQQTFRELRKVIARNPAARPLILILLDAEGGCPALLASRVLSLATAAVPADYPVSCVFANRSFENWIVAGASTLAGVNGLPDPLPPRDRFEELRGARWLDDRLREQDPNRSYKKTKHAIEFLRHMDLPECRANCPSFDKLCRDLASLASAPPAP